MFTVDQLAMWKTAGTQVQVRITAQRVYTDRYTHWDIEVMDDLDVNGVPTWPKGSISLGIPEHQLS